MLSRRRKKKRKASGKGHAPKAKDEIKTSGQDKTTYVTALGCQALASPDGRVAIQIVTQERGPIAFLVDQLAIDLLRQSLGRAETILRLAAAQSRPN